MPPLVVVAWITLATAVAAGGAGVAQTAIAANAAKGDCEKDCKEKCKGETGWLFSGRQKCIKKCRADACTGSLEPPPPPPDTGTKINWWYVVSGVLVVGSILLFVFRKKIFPAK